jgi:nucleoside-diphosphate-sugar epimerase
LVLARGGTVLRLPTVVGSAGPEYQLIPYLHKRIMRGERIKVQREARRNLVDVVDVVAVAMLYAGSPGVFNVAATLDHSLSQIISTLEFVTGREAHLDFVDGGSNHRVKNSVLETGPEYMFSTLEKYFDSRIPARAPA